ncbi:MAG: ABC transporter substrate-binding protein [Spirochaetaceae bacterium]
MQHLRVLLPQVTLADPHLATDSHAVLVIRRLLFDSLIDFDGSHVTPLIAESWKNDEGGKRWTFRIERGVLFPDGRELNSRDVAYSLKRAASADAKGQLFTVTCHSYFNKAEIESSDPYTLVLRNPEPIADLAELLADIPIVPEGWKSYENGTGTGLFVITKTGESHLLLEKRETTERPLNTHLPNTILFEELPDPTERLEKVKRGEADLALDPPIGSLPAGSLPRPDGNSAAAGKVSASAHVSPISWQTSLCVIFYINCFRPELNDPGVRRAINLAVDVDSIIETCVSGHARPLNGPLSARHFARDPNIPPYPHDPDKARELLSESGIDRGFVLEIHAPTTLPSEGPELARAVAADLEKVGFATKVVLHEDRYEYARRVANKELEGLTCFDSSPSSSFKVLNEKIDSRFAGPWWQGYHNKEVNRLLTEAAATPDRELRQEIYHRAYRLLHDDPPWLFLYNPDRFWAAGHEGIVLPKSRHGASDRR